MNISTKIELASASEISRAIELVEFAAADTEIKECVISLLQSRNINPYKTDKKGNILYHKNEPRLGRTTNYILHTLMRDMECSIPNRIKAYNQLKDGLDEYHFFRKAKKFPINISQYFPCHFSQFDREAIFEYCPRDWSRGEVGKGEFAFILLFRNARMATAKAGAADIDFGDLHLEIKGLDSRLTNQNSHRPCHTVKSKALDQLNILTKKNIKSIRNINKTSLENFYNTVFPCKYSYAEWMIDLFSYIAMDHDKERLQFVHECIDKNACLDIDAWKHQQALFEYEYYMKTAKHDRVLFFNPNKGTALLTENVDDVRKHYKYFDLSIGYGFNDEKGKTLRWTLNS